MQHFEDLNVVDIQPVQSKKNITYIWLIGFYRRYLKRFVIIAKLARWVYVKLLPFLRFVFLPYLGSSEQIAARRQRSMIRQNDLAINHGLTVINIFKKTCIEAITPLVYPLSDKLNLVPSKDQYIFPDVFITSINDAEICGGSNLIFYKNKVIYHDLYDFNHDYTSEEMHGYMYIKPKKNTMRLYTYDKNPIQIKQAASFVDATATNYAHWLSEVLPRIALFCSMQEYKKIPIIIDRDLHNNILDSLTFIVNSDREIIKLPIGRMLKVGTLYITSATGYVPFDTRPNKNAKHSHDGVFSPQALSLMRENIVSKLKNIKNTKPLPKKVLIMRNSTARSVQNIIELKNILISKGFETVEPEKLSFVEQVQIFSNADHIIAPTGAALGSAIFCSSAAQVTVMMGKHENMIYRYWVEMLKSNNIKVNYLLGEIVGDKSLGIHGNYIINKEDLVSLLESMGS